MNQRQLASVLFAVVGVFIAASRLPEIFIHMATLAGWNPAAEDPANVVSQRSWAMLGLLGALIAVLAGCGLAVLRDRLAGRLFPAATQPMKAPEVQAVALSVLGCYLAVQGIAQLVWGRPLNWSGAAQLALGVALFFGARGLSRIWSRSRSTGWARMPGSEPTGERL